MHLLLLVSRREVYTKPAVLTPEAEDAFCQRLEEHIREFELPTVSFWCFMAESRCCSPSAASTRFLKKLRAVEERTGCMIKRGVTTNAILVDDEWIRLFKEHDIASPSASMARPRSTTSSASTSRAAARWRKRWEDWRCLRAAGYRAGADLGLQPGDRSRKACWLSSSTSSAIKQFDILPPDATHADNPPPIDDYFIRLFDVWFDKYAELGVDIARSTR